MKRGSSWFVIALFLACFSARADATIEGHVPLAQLSQSWPARDPARGSAHVLSSNLHPPVAVIYLEGNFPRQERFETVRMAQKDMGFEPFVLPIQVGTKVEFPNLDLVAHNVFSYSAAKRFELGTCKPKDVQVPAQLFDIPGLVTVRCDVHDEMRAYILVLETPFFTKTDGSGVFRLSGLPSGKFVLKAWLSSRTTLERRVELEDGAALRVEFAPGRHE